MYLISLRRKLLIGIVIFLITYEDGEAKRVRKHEARIVGRPDEVTAAKCGEDIRLACVAEGKPAPEVEWWYHNQDQQQRDGESRTIIRSLDRDGRVKIKVEELYIVRSTLIITNAEEIDEGIYQCRASNSPDRTKQGINIYQHWKIEQVPVHKVMCGESALTQTEVIPASKYNQSVYSEAIERAITSFGVTSTTSTAESKIPEVPKEKLPRSSPRMITSQMTSSTTTTKSRRLNTRQPYDPRMNQVQKPKKKDKNSLKESAEDSNDKKSSSISSQAVTSLTEESKVYLQENKTFEPHGSLQEQNSKGNKGENAGTKLHQGRYFVTLIYVISILFMTSSC